MPWLFKWIAHAWRISKWVRFVAYVVLFLLAVAGLGPWAVRMNWLTRFEKWVEAHAAHPIIATFIVGLFFSTWLLPEAWGLIKKYFIEPKEQLRKFYVQSGVLIDRANSTSNEISMTPDIRMFIETVSDWLERNRGPAARARFLDLGTEGNPQSAALWNLKIYHQNLKEMIEKGGW